MNDIYDLIEEWETKLVFNQLTVKDLQVISGVYLSLWEKHLNCRISHVDYVMMVAPLRRILFDRPNPAFAT